jgi:hypothetical protein
MVRRFLFVGSQLFVTLTPHRILLSWTYRLKGGRPPNDGASNVKSINVKAGERKRIIFQFSNSLQQTHNFMAEPHESDSDPSGLIEVKGSNWLLPKPMTTFDLTRENAVEKGAWDTFYSVYVTPEVDTKITVTSSPIKNLWLYLVGALIIVAIASSLFFSGGGGNGG